MKLRTHYIFSAGLISIILAFFNLSLFANLFISFYASFVANTIIDRLGHEMKRTKHGYLPVRSPLTHTVYRSIIWGIISVLPLLLLYYVYHYHTYHYYYSSYYSSTLILSTIAAGIIVGPSHMLLDSLTEEGIYTKKNGKWRRVALAHFRYNDPVANGIAILVGVILLILSYNIYHFR
ncbi:DUF1286 domain-containing protein (plasmid) [Sulfolobus tengchongensis]|uniref:DUF1286 domain-containing protein n=1 Tax=Sulfolobus tengchongensis TaxID=207809 RepID=A0AAX4L3T9_9CREN